MHMGENRPTIEDSMSTIQEIEGREQLVRHIFDTSTPQQLASAEVEGAYGPNK
jgi:hypothetical protein